tara:strand:+ start:436 stop:705 length:270 start_codon:yes stop_codon:yes gene_type:complete
MVVGDVVSGIFAAGGNFQPAVGAEVMILTGSAWNGGWLALTDGITLHYLNYSGSTQAMQNCNVKIGLTNTIYLNLEVGQIGCYSGVQIK